MPKDLNWRLFVVGIVTLLCLYLIYPTACYFYEVTFGTVPEKPSPGETEEAMKAYEEVVQEYEDKMQEMRDKSIKLGLDLQGGFDGLYEVDVEDSIKTKLENLLRSLHKHFAQDDIDAKFEIVPEEHGIIVSDIDAADARIARGILEERDALFNLGDLNKIGSEEQLLITLKSDQIQYYADEAIKGAEKVIRRRVDEIGVTQPSVALQGSRSIRIQIPGEKNPERVEQNIIKPAFLTFRLLHDENDKLISEYFTLDEEMGTYGVTEGRTLPDGFTWLPGDLEDRTGGTFGEKKTIKNYPYIVRDEALVTGEDLEDSWTEINYNDIEAPVKVHLEFKSEGTRRFRDITTENTGRRLAVALDDYIYSAPAIDEPIPHGRCFIRGDFTPEEARDLSLVLKAGAMPAKLIAKEKRTVEASLGAASIRSGVRALLVGGAAVVVFMVLYYGTAGVIAVFALSLNVLLILAVLSMARATLTLSGIGGILLTIGIAVDGNVLIYERVREEMLTGKPLRGAIFTAFKRAFTVIFDSNLTTLITALVLLQFAEGSVQGFALTMSIGLLANLYTTLTVTRTLTDLWVVMRSKISVGLLRVFKDTKINFLSLRHGAYVLSTVMMLFCAATLVVNKGPNFAVDFTGGILGEIEFSKETSTEEIRSALAASNLLEPKVQKVAGKSQYLIRHKLLSEIDGTSIPEKEQLNTTMSSVENALLTFYGKEHFNVLEIQEIGNEIGMQFTRIALMAVVLASLCILAYIGIRFKFIFGAAAVAALVHDSFITLGLITFLGRDVSLDVVSALLIALGYSINDTIVIFDRIRENQRKILGKTFMEVANASINQSLNRTFVTSLTTLCAVLSLFFLGGMALNTFALVLIIGVVTGTYSSSFVATPLLFEWSRRKGISVHEEKEPKEKEEKTKVRLAYRKVKPIER